MTGKRKSKRRKPWGRPSALVNKLSACISDCADLLKRLETLEEEYENELLRRSVRERRAAMGYGRHRAKE
jgi:hypothetical protein